MNQSYFSSKVYCDTCILSYLKYCRQIWLLVLCTLFGNKTLAYNVLAIILKFSKNTQVLEKCRFSCTYKNVVHVYSPDISKCSLTFRVYNYTNHTYYWYYRSHIFIHHLIWTFKTLYTSIYFKNGIEKVSSKYRHFTQCINVNVLRTRWTGLLIHSCGYLNI